MQGPHRIQMWTVGGQELQPGAVARDDVLKVLVMMYPALVKHQDAVCLSEWLHQRHLHMTQPLPCM